MQLNPMVWLDCGFDKATAWSLAREQLAVAEGPEGAMRVYRWMLVRYVVFVAAVFLYHWVPEAVQTPLLAVGGAAVSMGVMSGWTRMQAYKHGWLEGRRRMRMSLSQHVVDRPGEGLAVDGSNWLDTEFNYDTVHVLGLPPTSPPEPS